MITEIKIPLINFYINNSFAYEKFENYILSAVEIWKDRIVIEYDGRVIHNTTIIFGNGKEYIMFFYTTFMYLTIAYQPITFTIQDLIDEELTFFKLKCE